MRSSVPACAFALVACASSAPASLDEMLEPIRARHEVPAIGALVVERGEVVACGCVGRRIGPQREPVTADEPWHLASCGKAMTATVVARLVADGRLQWDTTMAVVFPELAAAMHPALRGVTVRQLLDHRSGLPANVTAGSAFTRAVDRHASPSEQRLEIVAAALADAPAGKPGNTYAYANTNYLIAGAVIERVTGGAWERAMRELLFVPLGMSTAGFGQPQRAAGVAELPVWYGPAGDVHCSLADWAKLARVHCGDGGTAAAAIGISPATLATMHTPVAGADYACGFVVHADAGGGTVLTHHGENGSAHSFVHVSAATQRIVLVACNRGGDAGATACRDVANALDVR